MSNRIISEEARKIMGFINELGGITDAQLDKFLGKNKKHKEYYIGSLKGQYIKYQPDGHYVSSTQQVLYSPQMETCAWVLLDNLYNEDGSMVAYYKIKLPGQISFLKNGILNYLALITMNDAGTLAMLEQNYIENFSTINSGCENPPFRYVFVITKMEVMNLISNSNLSAPFSIAYLKDFTEDGPVIEYYG